MKAINLAISIPNKGCDKNCPYCVSRMTGFTDANSYLMKRNTNKVITLASHSEVENVIITSKGEPFLNLDDIVYFLDAFQDFPTEVQTNGLWMARKEVENIMGVLYRAKLNVLAVSIDSPEQFDVIKPIITKFPDMVYRATINLTNTFKHLSMTEIFALAKNAGFRQISFRKITVPNFESKTSPEANWIHENVDPSWVKDIVDEFIHLIKVDGRFLRRLPYGAELYEYEGVSTTYFNYCIQDNAENTVRSLIYQEDGHLYTAWNSPGSIIF